MPSARGPRALASRVPAPLFIIGSGLTQYIGAAIAVSLFTVIEPSSVAWARVTVGAVVLLAWRRPWRSGLTGRDLVNSAIFGVALCAMNVTFYESIHLLPLGVAVSLEFLGPVGVAVVRGTGAGSRVAAVLALAGVASIGGLGLDLRAPGVLEGLAWVLAAAALWAVYIVLGQRIAQERSGITNLALGCIAGSLVFSPLLAHGAAPALHSWGVAAGVLGVALLSTVLPLSLEALALSRVSAPTFALLNALLPATSAIVGAILLRQLPGPWEVVGLVLVSAAVWLASRSGD